MIADRLRPILDAEYPRFSEAEMARRRRAVEELLADAGCEHLVFCGANRFGSAVQWLTGWPVTAEAVGVLSPGERDALFVQYHNHVPQARRLAPDADVAWGGQSSIGAAIDELKKRGARADCLATIGPLSAEQHAALSAAFGKLTSLNKGYVRLRMIKSVEEIDWLRIGAHFSDLGMLALRDGLRVGLTERELGDLVERAYVAQGGTNVIHYFGVTPMRDPQLAVPAQFPSTRRVQAGDIVFAEIAAAFWDYPGQVLRSFAVGEEPTSLYRDLHAAADAAFDAIAAVLRDGTHARAGDRGCARDRGRRLHHHRRSAARLWRRLSAADPRLRKPPRRPGAGRAVPRRHDRGDPAERGDARSQGGRADRRDGADYADGDRADAQRAEGLCTHSVLILRCERSEPRRMAANSARAAILRDGCCAASSG